MYFVMTTNEVRTLLLLSWNVRGLNLDSKKADVKNFILTENPDIIALQKTKLDQIDDFQIKQIAGNSLDKYAHISANGSAGACY